MKVALARSRRRYQAVPDLTPGAREAVRAALRALFGWRDCWAGMFVDSSRSVAVRLEALTARDAGDPLPYFFEVIRADFLERLTRRIANLRADRPARVAIDGVDGAGKTTLTDELAPLLDARGRPVVRVSIDRFHRPRKLRYARGPDSAEGYYRNTFDLAAFRARVLAPSAPGGDRRVIPACHDLATDEVDDPDPISLAEDGVVLVDGIFLHRPEVRDAWDFSVFLRAPFAVTMERAVARDGGDAAAVRARYASRYVPGQRLYLAEADPERHADWVVEHGDPHAPEVLRER